MSSEKTRDPENTKVYSKAVVSNVFSGTIEYSISRGRSTPSLQTSHKNEHSSDVNIERTEVLDTLKNFDTHPEGGYGWVCCVCVAFMNFATWGPNTCYGIFLSYFLSSEYFVGATPTDYALIGGMVIGLTLFLLPLSSILINLFGYRLVATVGILGEFASFLSSSYVTTIAGFYCTYGMLLGVSVGLLFGANTIIIPGWFLEKRAFANGITHVGVGVGGVVWSFAVHAMIKRTGNHVWAMRMLAVGSLVINTTAMLLIKVQTQRKESKMVMSFKIAFSEVVDVKVYKNLPLQLCTLWSSFTSFGYVILLFSLSNFAFSIGLSSQQATNSLAIFNGAQIIGRPCIGYFSEKIGRAIMTILSMFYTLGLLLPFWFNVSSYAVIIPFCLLLGLSAGVGSMNTVPLVADVVGPEKFVAGISYNNVWNGLVSTIAEVVALRLRNYRLERPYLYCQILVALMYFGGILCLLPYREWKERKGLYVALQQTNLNEKRRLTYESLIQPGLICYFRRMFYITEA